MQLRRSRSGVPADVAQLRAALRTHRLEQNLTFDELAEAIGLERVSAAFVRRFIDGTGGKPRETTLYAVRVYLARVAAPNGRTA